MANLILSTLSFEQGLKTQDAYAQMLSGTKFSKNIYM